MIITALNAEEFLEPQLLALSRQQTAVPWELIVADNGSTDGTLAVVERLTPTINAPVRIVDASAKRGISAARNAAVAVARGDLLLFTDADDVVDDRWLQEMVDALSEHPFVGGRLELVELNGEEVASWRPPTADQTLPLMGGNPYVVGCNFGCTAAAYAAIGGFDESIIGSEDVDVSMAMHAKGMTAFFAERAIVHYRYRREPRAAVRQMWAYGKSGGALFARHGVRPPTIIDAVRMLYRAAKSAARDAQSRRLPVRAASDVALVLAEASVLWRDPAFWHPTARRTRLANPVELYRQRLSRAARLHSRLYARLVNGRGVGSPNDRRD